MKAGDEGGTLSRRTIHEIYCGTILLAAIIILAAVQWYRIEKLVELVSFSLTITSLVLAVIAIGYSIFSGSSIERGVNNLLIAVNSVRSSATEIEALRDQMTKEVRAVADAVGGVASSVTRQSGVLESIAEQRTIANATPAVATVPVSPAPENNKSLNSIVAGSSLAGAIGILAVARCQERKVPIEYSKAFTGTYVSASYTHGYLVALSVAGVFSIEASDTTIKSVSRKLGMTASDIKAEIVKKIEGESNTSISAIFQKGLITIDDKLKGVEDDEPAAPAPTADK